MKKQIYIRADGSASIGLGHVVRALALAHMLKDNFSIQFVCMEIPVGFAEEVKTEGFPIKLIDSEESFFSLLTGNEIVILDHYGLDTKYQKKIKRIGSKLVCIDDLHDKEFYADLIINHAPGIVPEDYQAQDYTLFALGLEYALLRPAFLNAATHTRISEKKETLFICFGGSDSKNITQTALNTAVGIDYFKKINVVLGSAYQQPEEIIKFAQKDARIGVYIAISENEMVELMQKSDVAIVPASGILLESLAAGCKVISGMYVKNQKYVYESYKESGVFTDAKNFEKEEIEDALIRISDLQEKQVYIDGKSPQRFRRLFESFKLKDQIVLREATVEDLDITFNWASNQSLRKYSFSDKKISYEDHKNWFIAKVDDRNCIYFIAERNSCPIGYVRFDLSGNEAIISYLVDPDLQGKNIGIVILIKAFNQLKNNHSARIENVIGYVMPQNVPSQKSFRRLGYFQEFQEEKNRYKYSKTLK